METTVLGNFWVPSMVPLLILVAAQRPSSDCDLQDGDPIRQGDSSERMSDFGGIPGSMVEDPFEPGPTFYRDVRARFRKARWLTTRYSTGDRQLLRISRGFLGIDRGFGEFFREILGTSGPISDPSRDLWGPIDPSKGLMEVCEPPALHQGSKGHLWRSTEWEP